jgi:hypothetical protein
MKRNGQLTDTTHHKMHKSHKRLTVPKGRGAPHVKRGGRFPISAWVSSSWCPGGLMMPVFRDWGRQLRGVNCGDVATLWADRPCVPQFPLAAS